MNFIIVVAMILTCILSKITDIGNCSYENMHFEHLYNNDLSSSSEVNESKEHTHSLDTPYCECEFQDPLYVLGKPFDRTYIKNMCEMKIIGHATTVKNIKFTYNGFNVCKKICKKCRINIKLQNIWKNIKSVELTDSYCDLIDKTNDTVTNLATECVCVFRVQSYSWQSVVVYKFQANPQGLVKVHSN